MLSGGGTMEGAWINGALTATWFQIQGVERGSLGTGAGETKSETTRFLFFQVDLVEACHVQAQSRQTPCRPCRPSQSKPTVQEESQPPQLGNECFLY